MDRIIRISPEDKLNITEFKPVECDEWDQQSWSMENPVDYLKAVKLINSFPINTRDEVFKQIFTITRLYIPETLYKFYSINQDKILNELKLRTLEDRKVFLSEVTRFNDPYDGRAIFYNPDELLCYERLRRSEGILFDDFALFNKGTSLTAQNYKNMPMWAYYSENHRGYCVAYNTSENPRINSFAFPMQYIDARIDISDYLANSIEYILTELNEQSALGRKKIVLSDLTLIYVLQLLDNIKSDEWANEKEFRLSLPKTHPTNYIELKPHQIYIGMNCDVETEIRLLDIGKDQNIEVYKMEQGTVHDRFELKPRLVHEPQR